MPKCQVICANDAQCNREAIGEALIDNEPIPLCLEHASIICPKEFHTNPLVNAMHPDVRFDRKDVN